MKLVRPADIGIFGSSAGGGMVLSMVQRAQREGLPLPGVVMAGTPWADLSKTGDSYFTNAGVDNMSLTKVLWRKRRNSMPTAGTSKIRCFRPYMVISLRSLPPCW